MDLSPFGLGLAQKPKIMYFSLNIIVLAIENIISIDTFF